MNFNNLGLCKEILESIKEIGFVSPTEIQVKVIPSILMGRDVLGCAQTGTGKTASYMMPLIEILSSGKSKARMPRSLILAPTRELAMQVGEDFELINKFLKLQMALLIGGISFNEQDIKLSKGVDVLIATPGRLLDHVERGKVILKDIKVLIIDEADRMLDMGFIPDIEKVNKLLPKIRQTLFFSATLSKEIRKIGKNFLINPKEINTTPFSTISNNVESYLIKTKTKEKLETLNTIMKLEKVKNAVIFCNKKIEINTVSTFLKKSGFKTVCLHGDMNQNLRISSLDDFKKGFAKILIASDVVARGIDIEGLSHVFNFSPPVNSEDYIHRIGRTGRAGHKGKAFTICDDKDKKSINMIEKLINKKIEVYNIDSNYIQIKDKNISSQDKKNDKDLNKNFSKNKYPPIENFLNFKDSGKIPSFLVDK